MSMAPIERHGESAGALTPGANIAGTDYTVGAAEVLEIQRFVGSKTGTGYIYLQEEQADGTIVRRVPMYFAGGGTQDFPGLHFRVAAGNTVRCFVFCTGGANATRAYWEGALKS